MSAAGSLLLSSFGTEEPDSLSGQAVSMAGKCPPHPRAIWSSLAGVGASRGRDIFSQAECDLSPSSTHFLILGEKLLGLLPAEASCHWLQAWQAYTGRAGTAWSGAL